MPSKIQSGANRAMNDGDAYAFDGAYVCSLACFREIRSDIELSVFCWNRALSDAWLIGATQRLVMFGSRSRRVAVVLVAEVVTRSDVVCPKTAVTLVTPADWKVHSYPFA